MFETSFYLSFLEFDKPDTYVTPVRFCLLFYQVVTFDCCNKHRKQAHSLVSTVRTLVIFSKMYFGGISAFIICHRGSVKGTENEGERERKDDMTEPRPLL